MITPRKLSALFDDVSDLSTAANSAVQTPRRGGGRTPLKSPMQTPLRSPYRRHGAADKRKFAFLSRIFGSRVIYHVSLIASILGMILCAFIARDVWEYMENKKEECATGKRSYWQKCVEDKDLGLFNLSDSICRAFKEENDVKRVQPIKAMLEKYNGDHGEKLEEKQLRTALSFCDDLAVHGDHVYSKITKKAEYVTVVAFTLFFIFVLISNLVIRSKKH